MSSSEISSDKSEDIPKSTAVEIGSLFPSKSKNREDSEGEEDEEDEVNSSKGKSKEKKKKKFKISQEIFDPEFIKKHVGYIPKERLKAIREHPPEKKTSKKVREFEEEQDEYKLLIEAYSKEDFTIKERQEAKEAKRAQIGIRLSFACNVVLMVIKVVVLAISGSLAILASLIDSVLDLISGSIIFISSYLQVMRKKEYYLYPVGKRRLETIAVIVFAAAMFTATGELLIRAIEDITNPDQIHLSFDYTAIALVVSVIVIKFCLWQYCRKSAVPTVRALAQDHYNDVFSNSLGTIFGLCGYYFFDYLDPIGAFIIGLMIMSTWAEIAMENIKLMTGRSADPKLLSMFTYVAFHHDERIQAIESVRAYYVSNRVIVEVDIILPETMSLRESHDIGESLQMKLEKLPDIERAFVHLDFETEHDPYEEHPQLKELHKKIKKDQIIKLDESKTLPHEKDS